MTEALKKIIEEIEALPDEEQDRVAAALRNFMDQPPITSDVVRPEVIQTFYEMLDRVPSVLEYLKDR